MPRHSTNFEAASEKRSFKLLNPTLANYYLGLGRILVAGIQSQKQPLEVAYETRGDSVYSQQFVVVRLK